MTDNERKRWVMDHLGKVPVAPLFPPTVLLDRLSDNSNFLGNSFVLSVGRFYPLGSLLGRFLG